jgi:hypothetical protein
MTGVRFLTWRGWIEEVAQSSTRCRTAAAFRHYVLAEALRAINPMDHPVTRGALVREELEARFKRERAQGRTLRIRS